MSMALDLTNLDQLVDTRLRQAKTWDASLPNGQIKPFASTQICELIEAMRDRIHDLELILEVSGIP